MEIRASEDAAHIENLEVENAKLRAALSPPLRTIGERDRALRDFISDYYYGSVADGVIAKDADALLKWMYDRGWVFVPVSFVRNSN